MANFLISGNQTTRVDMSGIDSLEVTPSGNLSVVSTQAVRFNGVTTNGLVNNFGVISATGANGRPIRIEIGAGATPVVTIVNNTTGSITGQDDAIQIQAGAVTGGTVTLINSGAITSTQGQAVDFAGGVGTAVQNIMNQLGASITAQSNDAMRIGGVGTIVNNGLINGGLAVGYSQSSDGIQFENNASGTVTNNASISGDRHGVNAGLNTNVTVTNNLGATITGFNGSGVGLDGSGSIINHGTITGSFSNSVGSDTHGSMVGFPDGGGPDGINDGDGDGIDVDGQATIENFGTIEGTGAGGTGSDGRSNTSEAIAAGGGTITNHAGGIIRGLGLGILIDDSSTGPAPFVTKVLNNGSITGTNSFAIKLIGLQDDEVDNGGSIAGGGGVAMLLGSGNDTLKIRNGSVITGLSDAEGGTADLLSYVAYNTMAGASVNLATGTATGTSGVANFENVTGSDLADTLLGNASNNTLLGQGGNDTLKGAGGNDTLDGGGGSDTADYSDMTASVVVALNGLIAVSVTVGGVLEDIIGNIENVIGGSGDDFFVGDVFLNVFYGGGGTDVVLGQGFGDQAYGGDGLDYLYGGQGDNTLYGEEGNDALFGESGHDVLVGGVGADYIDAGEGFDYADGGDANDIFLLGAGNDTALGQAANDYFDMGEGDDTANGGAGDDIFIAGAGNDVIEAGLGLDVAVGGAGNDSYVVRSTDGLLLIYDFVAGAADDVLRLMADTGIFSFAQAQAKLSFNAASNASILTVDADTSVWLVGVSAAQLTAADFAFA